MDLTFLNKFAPQPTPLQDNYAWLSKFAPQTPAPTAPQTAPVELPSSSTEKMQTYQAIQTYNNALSYWGTGTSWSNEAKGVTIHKITEDEALAISERIKPAVAQYDLPLQYTLACLATESTLDPNCQNGNLGPGESNTANDPLGYDMGIAQLKLRYLVGAAPGVTDHDSALAFALDVNRAIPYHCSLMASKRLWAQNTIQSTPSTANVDPRMKNDLLLATAAYNFGQTGVMSYYETGQFPSHCQHVVDLTYYFEKQLGLANVFAGVASATQ